jgi:hypothetical protein
MSAPSSLAWFISTVSIKWTLIDASILICAFDFLILLLCSSSTSECQNNVIRVARELVTYGEALFVAGGITTPHTLIWCLFGVPGYQASHSSL